jgi:pimeloyl-ACP methyl ester carboxylesterase
MRLMLASTLALVVALLIAGCGTSATNSKADRAGTTTTAAPAPHAEFASLVDIGDGRKMYLQCRGTGSPTAVLISGFRGSHDDWTSVIDSGGEPKPSGSAVFPEVSKFTRVCAYDRPGTSRLDGALSPSPPVAQPTTAQDGAADLHALLRAAKQPGPYVLVAHSWGALIGRLYASTYPDEVSGLVLLDPGSEFPQTTLTPAQWAKFVRGRSNRANPKPWKRPTTSPASMRSGPPLRWARSPLSCSPRISALNLSLALEVRRRHARRGGRLRINSQLFWTPSTSPIQTAATSSKGSSPKS